MQCTVSETRGKNGLSSLSQSKGDLPVSKVLQQLRGIKERCSSKFLSLQPHTRSVIMLIGIIQRCPQSNARYCCTWRRNESVFFYFRSWSYMDTFSLQQSTLIHYALKTIYLPNIPLQWNVDMFARLENVKTFWVMGLLLPLNTRSAKGKKSLATHTSPHAVLSIVNRSPTCWKHTRHYQWHRKLSLQVTKRPHWNPTRIVHLLAAQVTISHIYPVHMRKHCVLEALVPFSWWDIYT